ncbi:hypothetical protein MIS45_10910 [Wielerella bovis]|uniref:hypothetical protein n=1 Tax=Wielerella bovis TaxID=2917790 RepID=UPI00201A0074|nr:hypothetical protein [Wielerella bovis]ULJ69230.1 hypothetical protein MIS45_10910 [Wielerella bovis]
MSENTAHILAFFIAIAVWLWFIYSLACALWAAMRTQVAHTPIKRFDLKKQPFGFVITVLVQSLFLMLFLKTLAEVVWKIVAKM